MKRLLLFGMSLLMMLLLGGCFYWAEPLPPPQACLFPFPGPPQGPQGPPPGQSPPPPAQRPY